jgi:hypothetical protein
MIVEKKHDASIPVVVPVIIPIVMVPMMVPVPLVPAVFIRVVVVAVTVVAVVVVRSVLLVSGVHVNSEPSSALDSVGAKAISPSAAKPKRKYLFIGFPELDGKQRHFMLLLGSDQVTPISVYTVFQCIAPTGDSLQTNSTPMTRTPLPRRSWP